MGGNIKFKQSNTIQWHDLSKDPKDLPKEDCGTYIAYNIYDETPDLYEYKNSEEGCWELLPSKRIFYSNNQIKVWCEIPKLENKTEPQELCETAILKDVIIADANCSTKPFYYDLSNGIRRFDKVVNTLVFCVNSFDTFCYTTEDSIEIEKIMKGIRNRKRFTIKYKKSSHKVIEIISETNTQEQYMEKYNEILKLKEMLIQHKIPFDFSEWLGGYHICYPSKDNVICSVIEHDGSYGREEDKLEIQGLLTEQESKETGDTVLGHLTAEDVFARINKHFENLSNPNNLQPVFPEQEIEKVQIIINGRYEQKDFYGKFIPTIFCNNVAIKEVTTTKLNGTCKNKVNFQPTDKSKSQGSLLYHPLQSFINKVKKLITK